MQTHTWWVAGTELVGGFAARGLLKASPNHVELFPSGLVSCNDKKAFAEHLFSI